MSDATMAKDANRENYVTQKHDLDCLQATLSNVTGIPYSNIPEFYKEYEKGSNHKRQVYDKWLTENGYVRVVFDAFVKDDTIYPPMHISIKNVKAIGILQKPDREFSHAVFLEFKENGDLHIFDPKHDSDYSINDLKAIEILIKTQRHNRQLVDGT